MAINFSFLDFIQAQMPNYYDELKIEPFIQVGKSGIKIKKKNRGKFTEYCGGTVTSACIARGKNSSDPAVRKRATFAANARAWKHQHGGVTQTRDVSQFLSKYKSGYNTSVLQTQKPVIEYSSDDDIVASAYEQQAGVQNEPLDNSDIGFNMNDLTYGDNSRFSGNFNKDKAASWAANHANDSSTGWCARYIRQALEAGGASFGHLPYAYMYEGAMRNSNIFKPIVHSNKEQLPSDYIPDKGDVAVIGRSKSHPYGHIAMYDGTKWVSDFKQNSWHGLKQFEGNDYTIWRYA